MTPLWQISNKTAVPKFQYSVPKVLVAPAKKEKQKKKSSHALTKVRRIRDVSQKNGPTWESHVPHKIRRRVEVEIQTPNGLQVAWYSRLRALMQALAVRCSVSSCGNQAEITERASIGPKLQRANINQLCDPHHSLRLVRGVLFACWNRLHATDSWIRRCYTSLALPGCKRLVRGIWRERGNVSASLTLPAFLYLPMNSRVDFSESCLNFPESSRFPLCDCCQWQTINLPWKIRQVFFRRVNELRDLG